MSNEFVTVRNTVNGGVAKVRPRIAEHDVFGKHLEVVPDGTKPLKSLSDLVQETLDEPLDEEVDMEEYDLEEEEE